MVARSSFGASGQVKVALSGFIFTFSNTICLDARMIHVHDIYVHICALVCVFDLHRCVHRHALDVLCNCLSYVCLYLCLHLCLSAWMCLFVNKIPFLVNIYSIHPSCGQFLFKITKKMLLNLKVSLKCRIVCVK